ncbi:MAG: hypothetical protein K8R99_01225 [Actinomycetia bacterium]|nr:hypothetical protein [Actinomycetes bacterium]
MSKHRGEVVVRVRGIKEAIAAVAAAAAQTNADAATTAAENARARASAHPLVQRNGPHRADELMTAVGVATALRETMLATQRRAELTDLALADARDEVSSATALRKAAERLVARRIAAVDYEQRRRTQRVLDESASRRTS